MRITQLTAIFLRHLANQHWSKVAISGEITVGALALTIRPAFKTIDNWLKAVSTTFHAQLSRKCEELPKYTS
ncbi:MAG TPA: hypothetical protein K8W17_04010 [Lapidilactobacillus dextrinicus]|uniref:Uncharacterized protein n=1 Tax=Lapidilactobacillus dextrinicus TaxID=51664 RepID=A0A921B3M4_9LACO|nr:hypothetical protein [Lapidilactobacillus dextrinicus]